MSVDRRKVGIFAAAAAVRLVLFAGFPSLPWLLTGRVEVSTPVTSFKRLQEGLYLYLHNVSPYDGGVFYQAPLLLPLFALIPQAAAPFITPLLYTLVDLVCAHALMQIADSGESRSTRLYTSPRKEIWYSSAAVAAGYLFNPLTIATCLGRSTGVFSNCAVLLATAAAVRKNYFASMVVLALAAYLSLAPVLLLPPMVLLCYDQYLKPAKPGTSGIPLVLSLLGAFFGASGIYLILSFVITGFSWEFMRSTYGVHLLLPDLTPNTGLWWYFFIEMFDSFREFFLGVFWLHMGSYVGGMCIRIRTQPLFVIVTMMGVLAIFKPYPSIADSSVYLSMVPLYRHIFPRTLWPADMTPFPFIRHMTNFLVMRYTFFAVAAILYASLLGPAFYWLWIYAGSGNANFFYAITLVWSLGLSFIVADSTWAVLRDEWEVERPEMKGRLAAQI